MKIVDSTIAQSVPAKYTVYSYISSTKSQTPMHMPDPNLQMKPKHQIKMPNQQHRPR